MTIRSLFYPLGLLPYTALELGPFPVGVTGTRKGWTDEQGIAFSYVVTALLGGREPTDFLSGGCVGVDEQAHALIAAYFPGCVKHVLTGHLPEYYGQFRSGPTSLLYTPRENSARNAVIAVNVKTLIAVPAQDHEILRSGTWQTVRMFAGPNRTHRVKDRPLIVIDPDGLFHVYTDDWRTEMNPQTVKEAQ